MRNEPEHDKTNKMTCAPSGLSSAWASAQSDRSLLCAQWVAKDPWFLHADKEDWSAWADTQADQSLRWAHIISLVLSRSGSNYFQELTELKEQLRDIMFYVEGQQKLAEAKDVTQEEIQESQVIVGAAAPSPQTQAKRTRKKNRW